MFHRDASRWLACFALLMALLTPQFCIAQELRGLTLGEALERTLSGNPVLAQHAAETSAAQARADRDALPPPFTLGADVENFAGSGSLRGVDTAEATLRLGRVIELGGKRGARRSLGEAEIARQRNLNEAAKLEATSRTRLRFVEVLADQRRLAVAREHVELTRQARDEVARAVDSARNPETDLHAAEIALTDAELDLEHAEHELATARVALASGWGGDPAEFGDAVGSLDDLPAVGTLDTLAALLDRSPSDQDTALRAQVLSAKRRLAETAGIPDLTATLGIRRVEGLGDQALVMSVSLPLGARSRAALDVRENEALEQAGRHRQAATRADRHRQLFEKYQELQHARSEAEALRERMLPAAQKSLALARRGFDAGRFAYQALALSQERWIELQRRRIDASARYHTLLAEIELLGAGTPGESP
jgi:cobalt-zinc-cadmium efflux system outer membrane protein